MIRALLAALLVVTAVGAAPRHIPDAVYYGGNHQNERVDPGWLAQHVTLTEQGSFDDRGRRFLRAGGRFAMLYTDPSLVPYCTWPAPYVCRGPIGADVAGEANWLHAPDGTRLHVVAGHQPDPGNWQERLNPGAPAVRRAYRAYTARYDGNAIFADDTEGDVDPTPPGARDYDRYKYGAKPREYCGEDEDCEHGGDRFLEDTLGLLEASAHPVFVNSGANDRAVELMRRSPHVLGAMLEMCMRRDGGDDFYRRQQTFIARLAAMRRYTLCLNYPSGDVAADRGFGLAAYWMSEDGTYAMLWETFPVSDGDVGLLPEFSVVPEEPVQANSVEATHAGFGIYRREFARCYEEGRSIGPCAAVVNTSILPMPLPRLDLFRPHARMSFESDRSWYAGGTVVWKDGVPPLIGPRSGLILR